MQSKLKNHSNVIETSKLLNIQPVDSFQAIESYRMEIGEKRKPSSHAHLENFILSEFEIDSETMEEHFQELLKYMMHNQLIDKIPHN